MSEEYVVDPITLSNDILFLKLTLDQLVEEFMDEDIEYLEPKVSCKKNTTEELVRILKLNRARRGDN
jgi:hypothetical protein